MENVQTFFKNIGSNIVSSLTSNHESTQEEDIGRKVTCCKHEALLFNSTNTQCVIFKKQQTFILSLLEDHLVIITNRKNKDGTILSIKGNVSFKILNEDTEAVVKMLNIFNEKNSNNQVIVKGKIEDLVDNIQRRTSFKMSSLDVLKYLDILCQTIQNNLHRCLKEWNIELLSYQLQAEITTQKRNVYQDKEKKIAFGELSKIVSKNNESMKNNMNRTQQWVYKIQNKCQSLPNFEIIYDGNSKVTQKNNCDFNTLKMDPVSNHNRTKQPNEESIPILVRRDSEKESFLIDRNTNMTLNLNTIKSEEHSLEKNWILKSTEKINSTSQKNNDESKQIKEENYCSLITAYSAEEKQNIDENESIMMNLISDQSGNELTLLNKQSSQFFLLNTDGSDHEDCSILSSNGIKKERKIHDLPSHKTKQISGVIIESTKPNYKLDERFSKIRNIKVEKNKENMAEGDRKLFAISQSLHNEVHTEKDTILSATANQDNTTKELLTNSKNNIKQKVNTDQRTTSDLLNVPTEKSEEQNKKLVEDEQYTLKQNLQDLVISTTEIEPLATLKLELLSNLRLNTNTEQSKTSVDLRNCKSQILNQSLGINFIPISKTTTIRTLNRSFRKFPKLTMSQ